MSNLNDLAIIAAHHGLAAAELPLARLLPRLRREGFAGVALDVLADSGEPEVARLRALSILQRQVEAAPLHRRAAA